MQHFLLIHLLSYTFPPPFHVRFKALWKSRQVLCKMGKRALLAKSRPDPLQQAEGDWLPLVLRRCSLRMYLHNLSKKSGPDSSRETWLIRLHVCHLNSEELLPASWHILQGNYVSSSKMQAADEGSASARVAACLCLWDEAACGRKALVVSSRLVELLGGKD